MEKEPPTILVAFNLSYKVSEGFVVFEFPIYIEPFDTKENIPNQASLLLPI